MEKTIIQSVKCESRLGDIPSHLISRILNFIVDGEFELFKNILEQCLKKEPVKDDFDNLYKIYHYNDPLSYDLGYKEVILGAIKFEFGDMQGSFNPENIFHFEFTPSIQFR